jgi:hypothetical protein
MASSTSKKLGLHDLVEDVLILILAECDIAGIITISKVSFELSFKFLRLNIFRPANTFTVSRSQTMSGFLW